MNPNASSFPPAKMASNGTEFEDEPPLLEGLFKELKVRQTKMNPFFGEKKSITPLKFK